MGCVLLVMALMIAGGWVRSLSSLDTLCIRFPSPQKLVTLRGTILWWSTDKTGDANPDFLRWETKIDAMPLWVGIGILEYPGVGGVRIIRYWFVLLPLLLFSAYLLLSNPRKISTRRLIAFFQTNQTLGKRITWGIACAVFGMLLNLGTPILVNILGLHPAWYGGGIAAVGYITFIGVGLIVSGLAGLITGLVRPGLQSLSVTLICLVVVDICLLAASAKVYGVSAIIKIALMVWIYAKTPKPSQASSAVAPANINSNGPVSRS